MYLSSTIKKTLPILTILALLSACGGGGSSGASDTATVMGLVTGESSSAIKEITGQFIDGPVAGLDYTCSSGKSGVTNSLGEFTCYDGNTITFKAGPVILGSILVNTIVTPVSLYPNSPKAAMNVARLIQSLDDDGDLGVITLDRDEVRGLKASLDIKADSFEDKLKEMLTSEIVSKEAAIAHLNGNLSVLNVTTALSSDGKSFVTIEPRSDIQQLQTGVTDTSDIVGQASNPSSQVSTGTSSSGNSGVVISGSSSTYVYAKPTKECKSGGNANHEGQVTDMSGTPLAGVHVEIGGCEQTTDSNGNYDFTNIVTSERAVVNFEKEGYFRNSAVIEIKEYSTGTTSKSPNHLIYALDKDDATQNYDAHSSKTLSADGKATIFLSGSIYVNSDGDSYDDQVNATIAYEDISTPDGLRAFPGLFEGISDDVNMHFESYGLIVFSLRDKDGKRLGISTNANITFKKVSGTTSMTIPLFYYDYSEGRWIEQGYVTRQSNGSYKGTVSHQGAWSIDKPVKTSELATYRGRMIYVGDATVKDSRVYAIGENWISTDVSTDAEGIFELKIIPDSKFTLKAYNYKHRYEAAYDGTLPAIEAGKTVQNRM